MRGMAYEAMSPLGISWGYLALLLLPILLAALTTLVVVRRGGTAQRTWLLVLVAVAAGTWTFFTIGAAVRVPIPQDPEGAECVVNPFGDNPDGVVPWDSVCGRALSRHLMVSTGPTLVMLGVTISGTALALRRRHAAVIA